MYFGQRFVVMIFEAVIKFENKELVRKICKVGDLFTKIVGNKFQRGISIIIAGN